jgi:hypothetical protein
MLEERDKRAPADNRGKPCRAFGEACARAVRTTYGGSALDAMPSALLNSKSCIDYSLPNCPTAPDLVFFLACLPKAGCSEERMQVKRRAFVNWRFLVYLCPQLGFTWRDLPETFFFAAQPGHHFFTLAPPSRWSSQVLADADAPEESLLDAAISLVFRACAQNAAMALFQCDSLFFFETLRLCLNLRTAANAGYCILNTLF